MLPASLHLHRRWPLLLPPHLWLRSPQGSTIALRWVWTSYRHHHHAHTHPHTSPPPCHASSENASVPPPSIFLSLIHAQPFFPAVPVQMIQQLDQALQSPARVSERQHPSLEVGVVHTLVPLGPSAATSSAPVTPSTLPGPTPPSARVSERQHPSLEVGVVHPPPPSVSSAAVSSGPPAPPSPPGPISS